MNDDYNDKKLSNKDQIDFEHFIDKNDNKNNEFKQFK